MHNVLDKYAAICYDFKTNAENCRSTVIVNCFD